jgi:hypothetical protein
MIDLMPGDIVCTTYAASDDDRPSFFQLLLSCGIRWAQCFNDVDGSAMLTHSFMATHKNGTTWEALWLYRGQSIFDAYAGRQVLIGRHKKMTKDKFHEAFRQQAGTYYGLRYPAWKIPMFFIAPRLIKYLPGKPVCSELVFQFLYLAGLVDHWRGVTPSYVSDAIRRWRDFEVVYDGVMPEKPVVSGEL